MIKKLSMYKGCGYLSIVLTVLMVHPVHATGDILIAAAPSTASATSTVNTPQARGESGAYYNGVPNNYYRPGSYNGYGYGNPYYQTYPAYGNSPYYNPYAPTYLGRYNIGGVIQPIFGPPQLLNGNLYGVNISGNPYTFWRAPSGFYYPWSSGFGYSDYPILTMPPNGSNPLQAQPTVETVISDLNSYLNKAKADGKISTDNYQFLQQKAQYLQKKAQSMAQSNEGVLDPDQEIELRKEIENLSSEVTYRVQP